MKRTTITLVLCLIPIFATAQDPQIIGGYLLDGKDSFEELEAAVLTDSKSKEKNLGEKGMRFPGGVIFMTPEDIGEEIGSIVRTKHPFLVKTISFTVEENRMEGCKASIRIYRIHDEDNLENIVSMPIQQAIPKTPDQTTFNIAPEESIVLDPGKYYISFSVTEIAPEIKERWADSDEWDENDRFTRYMQDRIFFPLYLKNSYSRDKEEHPLSKWGANIGLTIRGSERRS